MDRSRDMKINIGRRLFLKQSGVLLSGVYLYGGGDGSTASAVMTNDPISNPFGSVSSRSAILTATPGTTTTDSTDIRIDTTQITVDAI